MKQVRTPLVLSVAAAVVLAGVATVAARERGPAVGPAETRDALVARGRHLVKAFGCADCHTPWKMGPSGFGPDESRAYSGHPESLTLPPPPPGSEAWPIRAAGTMTAWAGPWGVSYPANLTPDPETGIGSWSEDDFVRTVRTRRHLGHGREILPPMPIEPLSKHPDEDLRAIFAYLRSLPPIKNRVPAPLPPEGPPSGS
jgi:hypothetical protein